MSGPLPCTCAGQGHPPVLLFVRGALVGSRRGYGKGRGRGQGAARVVQLPTRGHDHPVVVGEEGELCAGNESDPQALWSHLWLLETRGSKKKKKPGVPSGAASRGQPVFTAPPAKGLAGGGGAAPLLRAWRGRATPRVVSGQGKPPFSAELLLVHRKSPARCPVHLCCSFTPALWGPGCLRTASRDPFRSPPTANECPVSRVSNSH